MEPKPINGIDRVNPDLGYEEDNVVTACRICNRAKGVLTMVEFIEWIKQAHNYITKRS